jgi:hypothetical protein
MCVCVLCVYFLLFFHAQTSREKSLFSEKDMLCDFPVQLFTVSNCTPIFKEQKLVEIIIENLYTVLSECLDTNGKLDPSNEVIERHYYYR